MPWHGWVGTLVTLVGMFILIVGIVRNVSHRAGRSGDRTAERRKQENSVIVVVGVLCVAAGIALM